MKSGPRGSYQRPRSPNHMRKDRTMADRADITPELCRQLLRYEPETGKLFWRERPTEFFIDERSWKIWNTKNAGKEALTASSRGYRVGMVRGFMMKAHRVAWAIHYGIWPEVIDHINGNPADNRIVNLRSVTQQGNLCNQRRRSDNTSSRTGVYPDKGGWTAEIKLGAKKRYLGRHDTLAAAIEARDRAEKEMGFHPNHGR